MKIFSDFGLFVMWVFIFGALPDSENGFGSKKFAAEREGCTSC